MGVVDTLASLASHVEAEVVRTLLFRVGRGADKELCLFGASQREQSHQKKAPAAKVKVTLPSLEREFHLVVASGGIVRASCRAWLRTRPVRMAL